MNLINRLKNLLCIPETADLNLDSPELTAKRREILQSKGFLRHIYTEWYDLLSKSVPPGHGEVLEIGTGGGFLREIVPKLITSDVFVCSDLDIVLDACEQWPLNENSLKAVLMVDVLHHLPDVHTFFHQAEVSIRPGGVVAMIEPWVTPWSRIVYTHLHHEPFMPSKSDWTFPANGPLSGANSALPWNIFHRDRCIFEKKFPKWHIETIRPFMPIAYILSGGISLRSIFPRQLYPLVRKVEKISGLEEKLAMFAYIALRRN